MSCYCAAFSGSATFFPTVITRIGNLNNRASFSGFNRFDSSNLKVVQNPKSSTAKRWRRFSENTCSLDLPLLPFNMNEIMVPTELKILHLYEARYLALLEESLSRTNKLFVHFVLDPISINDSGSEASFAARYGCLVLVENVDRLDVGALVSIRGIGRVKLRKFSQVEPYLKGEVLPMHDTAPEGAEETSPKITAIKDALYSLNKLEIKLKTSEEEPMQTHIMNSLNWAEKEPCFECDKAFIPSLAERVSFGAFQPISGSTKSELVKLQQEKLMAMELISTIQRLENSIQLITDSISMIAAKLAIQSLDIK